MPDSTVVAVIGLGYVGLPLAVEFGKRHSTIGFDLSEAKVAAYRSGVDPTGEVHGDQLRAANGLRFTTDAAELRKADFIVVAVPTPVDEAHQPDFGPLLGASASVGANLKRGATIVFESTVYPGATEEICVPVIEQHSGHAMEAGFLRRLFAGAHQSGRQGAHADAHHQGRLRRHAGDAGARRRHVRKHRHRGRVSREQHPVAEAAKVIENTQRDLNIALMNELALLFHKIGIDTTEVLEAAGTKWNFLPFRPGLVGGHCIGVDPYYLTHKADKLGYHPQVILAGRRINDGMGKYVAEQTVKHMIQGGSPVKGAHVTVLGLTFKENCPDIRNSRVIDVVHELASYGLTVHVHDPVADPEEAQREYGVELEPWDALPRASAIVAAVAHREFRESSRRRLRRQACGGRTVRGREMPG